MPHASRSGAARLGNVTLQIVRDPPMRFNAEGPDGLRDRKLSARAFRGPDGIVEHCCHASNRLVDQLWRIISIGLRHWTHGF